MALYTIGDLHLSLGKDKPMDIFGENWKNHAEKLRDGFSALRSDDVCVICGDISWAMSMEAAREDFLFINSLPGQKVILKGNHDFWWSTENKARTFFQENGIDTIKILNNNFIEYKGLALCGTRGWLLEEEENAAHDIKIMRREAMRLETSLKAAGDREKLVFMHYPPLFMKNSCPEILALLERYGVKLCCYGHIHGKHCSLAFNGTRGGTEFKLVSADFVNFTPIMLPY